MRTWIRGAALLGVSLFGGVATAHASTMVGGVVQSSGGCASGYTFIQTVSPANSYAFPSNGIVTSWSFQANTNPPTALTFKVARSAGGHNYTIVGTSTPQAPPADLLSTYPAQIPVQANDVLGMYVEGVSNGCSKVETGYDEHYYAGEAPFGTPTPFGEQLNEHLNIAAVLEPDADGDTFGDDTQDECPTDAARQHPECFPPDTTITKHPPKKTKKKRVTFEFSATEPGSTFACSLDGARFATCTSPDKFKAKKRGKHTFAVRATDAVGNADQSAAEASWKRKKPKG